MPINTTGASAVFFCTYMKGINMFDTIFSTVRAFEQLRSEPWNKLGNTLLVGEGNLSFARSLINMPSAGLTRVMATVFEPASKLSEEAIENAQWIKRCGGYILYDIDATKLDSDFPQQKFDTIIFQFPNVGSRKSKYGHTSNHVMARKFLRAAKICLEMHGKVLLTLVDNPHYRGIFKPDEAATFSGYKTPHSYPFDASKFRGYAHTNTNNDDSAAQNYNRFVTWVFEPE
tara:strand:- start:16966 stop:17655 length:690 start_codon:yes stop_codon:yes gene_type:complete